MSNKLLILGSSGKGKTSSIETMDNDKTVIFQCVNKRLPFKSESTRYSKDKKNRLTVRTQSQLMDFMVKVARTRKDKVTFIVDDYNYLLLNEYMDARGEHGFSKFERISFGLADTMALVDKMPDNITVVFIAHTQINLNGELEFKSVGKFVSEKIVVEGLFDTVFLMDDEYRFITNGTTPAKSGRGMFEDIYIENDLNVALEIMDNYFE